MPSQKSLKVSTIALACAMSATLILGGCGDKNKPKNAKIVKLEKVEPRKVGNAEAEKALTALSLNQSGSGAMSWASRAGESGNYTYSDVVVKGDKNADITIATVELWGAHMASVQGQGEQASFDKIEFRDFEVTDKISDENLSIGRVSLVKPSPALAASIGKALGGDENAFESMDGDIGFQAMSFSNMKVSDSDANMSIKSMSMGEANDKTGVFSITGLELDAKPDDEGGGHVKLSLGSFDVTGANLEKYKGLMAETLRAKAMTGGSDNSEKVLANIMASMNVFDPDFKAINLRDLNINADGLLVTLKSYEANANKKDGIVTMSQKMSPLSIIPPKDGKVLGQKRMSKMLSTMGYDRFEFTMGGNSVIDENNDTLKTHDSYIEMRDGFRFSYDVDISGYKAFTEQAAAAQSGGSMKNPIAAMGMASALEINTLRFALRDDSIVERYFKMAAEQQDTTPDALKQKIRDSLERASMEAKDAGQQKLADELRDAVSSFLDGGGTFVFEMTPTEPVNPGGFAMGAMMGGAPDIASLGITISTQ